MFDFLKYEKTMSGHGNSESDPTETVVLDLCDGFTLPGEGDNEDCEDDYAAYFSPLICEDYVDTGFINGWVPNNINVATDLANYLDSNYPEDDEDNCVEIDFEERITTNLPPCLSTIMNEILTLQNGKFSEVLKQFSGINSVPQNYNWIVIAGLANGNPASAATEPNIVNGFVKTRIFTDSTLNATDLHLAQVMIHEAFHAYLVFVYRYANIDKSYTNLLNRFADEYNNNAGDAHHAFFIEYYIVEEIATSMMEYSESIGLNLSSQYYNDLAWGGLTHISGGSTLHPAFLQANPNSSDRQRILQILEAEKTNSNTGNYSPQGTRACD